MHEAGEASRAKKASPSSEQRANRRVRVDRLKIFALEKIPRNHPLREVILAEEDEISAAEFVGTVRVWLKLLRRVE